MDYRVLVYKPGCPGEVQTVANDLSALQAIVGGYIEEVRSVMPIPELVLICNEEGRLLALPKNRFDIHGTFFITRCSGEDYASLTDADLILITNYMHAVSAL
jgi:hypothetical protein